LDVEKSDTRPNKVVLYGRVSSSENKSNLESQLERLRNYASAKGYEIVKEVKEVGSDLNDKRPQSTNIDGFG
jgi:predicted site-specific integrase-resolvase